MNIRKPRANGTLIRQLCQERGISFGAVSKAIGIDPGYFSHIISGQVPLNERNAAKLAKVLLVKPEQLVSVITGIDVNEQKS